MLTARSSAVYTPAAAQATSWGQEINALVVTDGVVIAGYGDWGSNTGPIQPGELPVTDLDGDWIEGAVLATEAVHLLSVLADGRVLAPAIDPQGGGDPNGSNYGERDPATGLWADRVNRISQLGAHFFDIVECDGHLFAAGAAYETTYGTGNAGGAIWESDDDGATWSLSYSHFGPTPAFDLDRFYYLAVVGDEVFARASPSVPEVKWTLADGWETSTGLPSAGQPGKAFRDGWVVPVEEPVAQPLYLFDGSTSTLFAESVVVWDVGDDGALYYVNADFMLRTVPATGPLTPVDVQQLDGSVGLYTSMAVLPGSESFVLGTADSALVILEPTGDLSMPYSTAAKNLMLNALKGTNPTTPITHVSLHTDDPGDTGTNEVTGGSPAYARKAIAFNAASSGAMDDSTNGAVFDVPAGTTVKHVGFWSASTAGTFLGSDPVTNEVFAAQGTYTLTDADLDLNA